MRLLRSLLVLGILAAIAYGGVTIKLGDRTLFGHIVQIWKSDETQELVDGVKETSGPMVERFKRGVEAGVEEAGRDVPEDERDGKRPRSADGDGEANAGRDTNRDVVTHPAPGL